MPPCGLVARLANLPAGRPAAAWPPAAWRTGASGPMRRASPTRWWRPTRAPASSSWPTSAAPSSRPLTAVEELIDPALAGRVRISRGPLVEGTFVAAVQASAGDGLDGVLAAADEAASMDKLEGR